MNWLEFVKVLVPPGWPTVTVIVVLLLKGEIFTSLQSILQRRFEFELPGAGEQQKSADQNPVAKELTVTTPAPSQRPALNRIVDNCRKPSRKLT
jgi:hypothetical protein